MDNCFSFLNNMFNSIYIECEASTNLLLKELYIESITRTGKAAELITESICEYEDLDYLNRKSQKERLEILGYKSIIPIDEYRKFNQIRRIRNKAVHRNLKNQIEHAESLHHKLFELVCWFYKNYGPQGFISPEYVKPNLKHVYDDSTNVKPNFISSHESVDSKPLENVTENPLDNYPFKTYNGSYLLNELSKLRDSSKEAVESDDDLSDFKKYIHVDRSIQNDFIKELKRVADLDKSHLIMLCGSVGDGKSHLLAYLKTEYSDLYSKFKVHNDATESFDPDKDAIDTLADVLVEFNDENIENSSEKRVLAINLGVLNNFLESEYAESNYTKLKQYVDNASIFDSSSVSKNIIQDKVSFITFSDYNLFELNEDYDSNYVSSNYISSLMDKITQNNDDNPFYIAYLKDKEQNYVNPLIYNYEMLSDNNVQKVIIDHLIKIFIKYRKIVSTRDLLNFFYELIVPPEILDYDNFTNVGDFIGLLLPNLLFNSPDRSYLLNLFSTFDPTLVRNEELDKFIIELNIKDDLENVLNKYFDLSNLKFLDSYFSQLDNLFDCNSNEKRELTSTLIRFALFYGKSNMKQNFVDENYLNFLKYLHGYNTQNPSKYKEIFTKVRDAIFMLRGSNKKSYIYLNELNSFKVSRPFKLRPVPIKLGDNLLDGLFLGNRFKTEIKIHFVVLPNDNKISLDIDYSLYESIMALNAGFKPNKSEKENLILFEEFINNLIEEPSDEGLLIQEVETGLEFYCEHDDFGDFSFKRG